MESILIIVPERLCLFGKHMDWCRKVVLTVVVDVRVFFKAIVIDKEVIEVYSYPPFKPYSSFPASNPNINYVESMVTNPNYFGKCMEF